MDVGLDHEFRDQINLNLNSYIPSINCAIFDELCNLLKAQFSHLYNEYKYILTLSLSIHFPFWNHSEHIITILLKMSRSPKAYCPPNGYFPFLSYLEIL